MIKPLNAATTEKGRLKMRLIDADKARAALEQAIRNCDINNAYDRYYCDGLQNAKLCLAQPTIEERKHGHWVQVSDWDKNGQAHFDCSVCGAGDVHADEAEVPYCWHCGAVMDEVAEDEVRQNK